MTSMGGGSWSAVLPHIARRLAFPGAALPSVARTELLYLACLALLYLRSWHGLLSLVCFGWFEKTALGLLACEARFSHTDYA